MIHFLRAGKSCIKMDLHKQRLFLASVMGLFANAVYECAARAGQSRFPKLSSDFIHIVRLH